MVIAAPEPPSGLSNVIKHPQKYELLKLKYLYFFSHVSTRELGYHGSRFRLDISHSGTSGYLMFQAEVKEG